MNTKQQFREYFLQLRQNNDITNNEEKVKHTSTYLTSLLSLQQQQHFKDKKHMNVAAYVECKNEFPILFILQQINLTQLRINLSLPFIENNNKTLLFKDYHWNDKLQKNQQYKIPEPLENKNNIIPDIIIAPAIAVDTLGNRIGYGKGYYDYTLKKYKQKNNKLLSIATVWHNCIDFTGVPSESHDEKIDIIFSEQSVFSTLDKIGSR